MQWVLTERRHLARRARARARWFAAGREDISCLRPQNELIRQIVLKADLAFFWRDTPPAPPAAQTLRACEQIHSAATIAKADPRPAQSSAWALLAPHRALFLCLPFVCFVRY